MKYRVNTRMGVNTVVEADTPQDAIKTLTDKELIIKKLVGDNRQMKSNVTVTLLDGQKMVTGHYYVANVGTKSVEQIRILENMDENEGLPKQYEVLNEMLDGLEKIDAKEFIEKAVNTEDKEGLKKAIRKGYIPFATKYGKSEINLIKGELEYDGISMKGNQAVFKQIQEIQRLIEEQLAQ